MFANIAVLNSLPLIHQDQLAPLQSELAQPPSQVVYLIGDVVELVEFLCLAILSTPGEREKRRENPRYRRRTASFYDNDAF